MCVGEGCTREGRACGMRGMREGGMGEGGGVREGMHAGRGGMRERGGM